MGNSDTFVGELSFDEVTTFVDSRKLGSYTTVIRSTPVSREQDKVAELNKQLRLIAQK